MRLRDQIRAAACVAWTGVLGFGTYFACEARPSRAGVIREGTAGGTLPAGLGAQEAQSRPRTGEPHTGERTAAKASTPGYASESPTSYRNIRFGVDNPRREGFAPNDSLRVARSRGVRHVPAPESTRLELERNPVPGSYLRQMATKAANLCGVPPALFHALIERESSWRPHVVSRAGAVGLAQVKPSTGREVSPTLDVRDPWQNLVAGACYLRRQFDRFGTWRKALHAYRLGPNARVSIVAREYASDIITGSAQ